jgi:vacuolar-type H+-ATPase subunit F/Vma7
MEILVAVISAVGGLFLFQAFRKYSADKGQAELVEKVKKLEKKEADLIAKNEADKKETEKKIDEITKEQEKKLTSDDLANWFNKRK